MFVLLFLTHRNKNRIIPSLYDGVRAILVKNGCAANFLKAAVFSAAVNSNRAVEQCPRVNITENFWTNLMSSSPSLVIVFDFQTRILGDF